MSETHPMAIGSVGWFDLTVEHAEQIRDFYTQVVGWSFSRIDMGGYFDYNMLLPASDTPVAGICHARGENADLPSQWLLYITVADIDASAKICADLGGKVLSQPKSIGHYGRICVIQDLAGAVAALFQPAQSMQS